MMPISASISAAASSGVHSASPFSVVSGGGKQTTLIIIAVVAIALVGLVLWFQKR